MIAGDGGAETSVVGERTDVGRAAKISPRSRADDVEEGEGEEDILCSRVREGGGCCCEKGGRGDRMKREMKVELKIQKPSREQCTFGMTGWTPQPCKSYNPFRGLHLIMKFVWKNVRFI